MTFVAVGVDHRSTSAELLERLVSGTHSAARTATEWVSAGLVDEAVVLSTCLRTEVYLVAAEPETAIEMVQSSFASSVGTAHSVGFALQDDEAATHLFRVAAGLESMVLGEAEILGQVARAWEAARQEGSSGVALDGLFRHAVAAGKRARNETSISQGVTSIAHAAIVMARTRLGDLAGRRALVIGAGDLGERTAVAARDAIGDGQMYIANRTLDRGVELADRVNGAVIEFDEIEGVLPDVDVVFSSTGSIEPVITQNMAMGAGETLIVDLAVPRDTESGVEELTHISVLSMNDLRLFAQEGLASRSKEIASVERIIKEVAAQHAADAAARSMAPVVIAFRERAEFIRSTELDRHRKRLESLTDEQRDDVVALTTSMMNKLLHDPCVRLKDAAGTQEGDRLAQSLRILFGI